MTLLAALPTISVFAEVKGEGEEEMVEGDLIRCKIRVMLVRPSHSFEVFEPPASGKAIRACTPLFPHAKEEQW